MLHDLQDPVRMLDHWPLGSGLEDSLEIATPVTVDLLPHSETALVDFLETADLEHSEHLMRLDQAVVDFPDSHGLQQTQNLETSIDLSQQQPDPGSSDYFPLGAIPRVTQMLLPLPLAL